MRKFAVMVFPDEEKAYQGLGALEELHAEGSLTVHGAEVIQRGADGGVSVVRPDDRDGVGTGLGALVGGLIGVVGGPLPMAAGLAVGATAGAVRDLVVENVTRAFVTNVERTLAPGAFAVIVDISEEWVVPLDTRMARLGTSVLREDRRSFEAGLVDEHVKAPARAVLDGLRAERAARREERAGAKADELLKKLLTEEIQEERWRLYTIAEASDRLLEHARRELNAKMDALLARASRATPAVRDDIPERIAELRADLAKREQKLRRAQELTRQALRDG